MRENQNSASGGRGETGNDEVSVAGRGWRHDGVVCGLSVVAAAVRCLHGGWRDVSLRHWSVGHAVGTGSSRCRSTRR